MSNKVEDLNSYMVYYLATKLQQQQKHHQQELLHPHQKQPPSSKLAASTTSQTRDYSPHAVNLVIEGQMKKYNEQMTSQSRTTEKSSSTQTLVPPNPTSNQMDNNRKITQQQSKLHPPLLSAPPYPYSPSQIGSLNRDGHMREAYRDNNNNGIDHKLLSTHTTIATASTQPQRQRPRQPKQIQSVQGQVIKRHKRGNIDEQHRHHITTIGTKKIQKQETFESSNDTHANFGTITDHDNVFPSFIRSRYPQQQNSHEGGQQIESEKQNSHHPNHNQPHPKPPKQLKSPQRLPQHVPSGTPLYKQFHEQVRRFFDNETPPGSNFYKRKDSSCRAANISYPTTPHLPFLSHESLQKFLQRYHSLTNEKRIHFASLLIYGFIRTFLAHEYQAIFQTFSSYHYITFALKMAIQLFLRFYADALNHLDHKAYTVMTGDSEDMLTFQLPHPINQKCQFEIQVLETKGARLDDQISDADELIEQLLKAKRLRQAALNHTVEARQDEGILSNLNQGNSRINYITQGGLNTSFDATSFANSNHNQQDLHKLPSVTYGLSSNRFISQNEKKRAFGSSNHQPQLFQLSSSLLTDASTNPNGVNLQRKPGTLTPIDSNHLPYSSNHDGAHNLLSHDQSDQDQYPQQITRYNEHQVVQGLSTRELKSVYGPLYNSYIGVMKRRRRYLEKDDGASIPNFQNNLSISTSVPTLQNTSTQNCFLGRNGNNNGKVSQAGDNNNNHPHNNNHDQLFDPNFYLFEESLSDTDIDHDRNNDRNNNNDDHKLHHYCVMTNNNNDNNNNNNNNQIAQQHIHFDIASQNPSLVLGGPLSLIDDLMTALDESNFYISNSNNVLTHLDTQLTVLSESRKPLVGIADTLAKRGQGQIRVRTTLANSGDTVTSLLSSAHVDNGTGISQQHHYHQGQTSSIGPNHVSLTNHNNTGNGHVNIPRQPPFTHHKSARNDHHTNAHSQNSHNNQPHPTPSAHISIDKYDKLKPLHSNIDSVNNENSQFMKPRQNHTRTHGPPRPVPSSITQHSITHNTSSHSHYPDGNSNNNNHNSSTTHNGLGNNNNNNNSRQSTLIGPHLQQQSHSITSNRNQTNSDDFLLSLGGGLVPNNNHHPHLNTQHQASSFLQQHPPHVSNYQSHPHTTPASRGGPYPHDTTQKSSGPLTGAFAQFALLSTTKKGRKRPQ